MNTDVPDIKVSKSTKMYDINQLSTPYLPLLEEMVAIAQKNPIKDLENTVIIGVQHFLETTVNLFQALINIGIQPGNMYFTGKNYSTCPAVEKRIRSLGINVVTAKKQNIIGQYRECAQQAIIRLCKMLQDDLLTKKISRLIILDEGGRCLENIPSHLCFRYPTAAIEQTTAGFYSNTIGGLPISIIDVAGSIVKRHLEPPLISEAVLATIAAILHKLDIDQNAVCGVVGHGAIGRSIIEYLLSKNHVVIVYDANDNAFTDIKNSNFYRVAKIENLIISSQFIFGCTGRDITKEIDIPDIVKEPKTFISCSSEDKEFLSFLQKIGSSNNLVVDPLSDIKVLSNHGNLITILRGGFPVNFDGTPDTIKSDDIQLTRALLFGACLQAISCAAKPINDGNTINFFQHVQLNPTLQQFIEMRWIPMQTKERFTFDELQNYYNIQWISKASKGNHRENKYIDNSFSLDLKDTTTYVPNDPMP